MYSRIPTLVLCLSLLAAACGRSQQDAVPAAQQAPADTPARSTVPPDTMPVQPGFSYHFEYRSAWKQKDSFAGYNHQSVLAAINRVDIAHLQRLDSFLVPDRYTDSVADYMPFPAVIAELKDISKIILFSYPAQAFAAYAYGQRVITGPTNMGKKATPTPQGLFFCNWKSRETRSTVNKEWILKWNFNVSNQGGVGFHQYALPGYPASHSCMRLWAEQAQFLYGWADQWRLSGDRLLARGTPVIVYGTYPFGQPRPWFALADDAHALDISDSLIRAVTAPHHAAILAAQQTRDTVLAALQATAR